MLTDDEIIKIAADTKTGEPGLHGYILPISFAREIERAVLAKAGEQEPVGFIDSEGDPHLSVEGLKGGYLYIGDAPLPAKAIPEWMPINSAPLGVDLLVFDGLNQFAPAWGTELKGGLIKWMFGTSQDCSPTHWRPLPDVSSLSASPKQ